MATHELKCWPMSFQAIKRGEKTFEVRQEDNRKFAQGDTLHLREFDPTSLFGETGNYTGDELRVEVRWLLRADESEFFGIKHGYVVMSVRDGDSSSSKDSEP